MGFVDPLISIVTAICLLMILLYKRTNLGIALNATALFLALLALDLPMIPLLIYETAISQLTISVVLATFGIMLMSQLYKETREIDRLTESISRLINNPRVVLGVLPAIIGLLPVAGGALMSAPLVDTEADKLNMIPVKKAYTNLWFRHTIFPLYPLSPPIITTALLTGVSIPLIIMRQIPVVVVMIIVGYVIGFRKLPKGKGMETIGKKGDKAIDLGRFLTSFSPILITIIIALGLELTGFDQYVNGYSVAIAILVGIAILIAVTRVNFVVFKKPFRTWGIYWVTLAAFGAFLLRNTMDRAEISGVFAPLVNNGSVPLLLFIMVAPAVLGLLTGSPQGGVAVSVSILSGILTFPFAPKVAGLIYISAYLGYTIAPTHLCFTFTADYFKCSLGKMYRYVLPSFLATFPVALLVYFLI